MQLHFKSEGFRADHFPKFRGPHLLHIHEAHVTAYGLDNILPLLIRKLQPGQNDLGHFSADNGMPVEADARLAVSAWADAGRWRFTDIVQQYRVGQLPRSVGGLCFRLSRLDAKRGFRTGSNDRREWQCLLHMLWI